MKILDTECDVIFIEEILHWKILKLVLLKVASGTFNRHSSNQQFHLFSVLDFPNI